VTSPRTRKIFFVVLLIASFTGLFPISIRLADPAFTHSFRTGWQYQYPVLWSGLTMLKCDGSMIFRRCRPCPWAQVTPSMSHPSGRRGAWVESKVRSTPSPNGNAAWIIHVKQLGHLKQRIQLELLGDGITGIVYEAGPEGIVPLRSRLAGPARAFVILAVNLLLWGGFWLLVRLIPRVLGARYRQRATTGLTRRV
jgi:hypothetical protein